MKAYLLLLSLFVMPFLSSAQRIDPKNIELGFTVSPNFGWMRVTNRQGQPIASEGSRAGVSYGVLADLGFARNYYFSTDQGPPETCRHAKTILEKYQRVD